jgi:hypothetical protein
MKDEGKSMRITIEYQEGKAPTVVTEPAVGSPGVGLPTLAQTIDGGAAPDFLTGAGAGDASANAPGDPERGPAASAGDALNGGPAPSAPEGFGAGSVLPSGHEEGQAIDAGVMPGDYRVH